MGLLDAAMKLLKRATSTASAQRSRRPWGGRAPDPAQFGRAGAPMPDLDALVTDAEIAAVTGGLPEGEPRRNGSDGTDVDLGRLVIRESTLSNGDTFLISLNNCSSAGAAQLAMDRMAELEKPLQGVGERGLIRVKTSPKRGTSEVGVTALTRNFTVSLTHRSVGGRTDPEQLAELLKTVLTRL